MKRNLATVDAAARIGQQLIAIGKAAKSDPETAHMLEDRLHRDVLRWIADGASDAQTLATLALRSRELEFPRHCA